MTPTASPTNKRSTHHVVLTQDDKNVGLILCNSRGEAEPRSFQRNPSDQSALQISQGTQKYADLSGHWKYIEQNDWSGGKGSKDFDKAADMYFDGYQVNTLRPGEVILAGKPTTITLSEMVEMDNTLYTPMFNGAYAIQYLDALSNATLYFRSLYTATKDIDVKDIVVILNRISSPPSSGKLYLGLAVGEGETVYSDNYIDVASIPQGVATYYRFLFTPAIAVSNGNGLTLTFKTTNLTTSGSIDVRAYRNTDPWASGAYYWSTDGINYTSSVGYRPYWLMSNSGVKRNRSHMFEYKGAMYYAVQNNDGSATKLYLNGDHGLAKAGATTSAVTIKGKAGWAANEAVGSILVIVSGTGSDQPQNWRVITSNDATSSNETALGFDDPFDIAPGENAVLAIVASDKFTELNDFDTAYDVVVTDVLSINGVVYFACGDSKAIKRMVAFNNGGTWIYHWSGYSSGQDAETGMFTYLEYSDKKIWGAKGGYPATVATAAAVDYTGYTGTETLLSFGTAEPVGDQYERITGLERYGESWNGTMVALKEGSLHRYREGKWEEFDIRQMNSTRDRRNGWAHCVQDTYLYFSWHNTILRYYNGLLDRVGPDKAEVAIPTENRHGYFSALVGSKMGVIGAVDAGANGVSSVIAYNDRGWCELYRGTLGERIQQLYVQSIPGNAVDRLWIAEGNSIVWIPISIDPFNHPADTYNPYKFCTEGTLITAWYYVKMQEINKLFYAIRFVCEGVGADEKIRVAYRVDDETEWTDVSGEIDTFSEELELDTTPSVTGKRIQFKFTLTSADGLATPRILAIVFECMPSVPVKHISQLRFRVADKDHDLLGKPDPYQDHNAKMNDLDMLEESARPVLVTSVATPINNRYAWVRNVRMKPEKIVTDTGEEFYIGEMTLVEIET